MRKVWIAIGVTGLAAGVGLGFYGLYLYRQSKQLMDYCIKFKDISFREIDRKKLVLDVILDFKNRSDLAVVISKYDLTITLNGIKATRIVYDADKKNSDRKPIVIAPKRFSPITLGIEILPVDELADWNVLSKILFDLNNTKIGFSGSISAKAGGISAKNIPINQVFKFKDFMPDPNAPKLPEKPCI